MRNAMDFNPFEDAFIGVRIEDGVAFATVRCTIVRERQASILHTTLDELAKSNNGRVLLDLCGVTMISTACISDLLTLQEKCELLGGKFVLYGLGREISESLKQTGVLKKMNLAVEEEGARRLLLAKPRAGLVRSLFGRKAA